MDKVEEMNLMDKNLLEFPQDYAPRSNSFSNNGRDPRKSRNVEQLDDEIMLNTEAKPHHKTMKNHSAQQRRETPMHSHTMDLKIDDISQDYGSKNSAMPFQRPMDAQRKKKVQARIAKREAFRAKYAQRQMNSYNQTTTPETKQMQIEINRLSQ